MDIKRDTYSLLHHVAFIVHILNVAGATLKLGLACSETTRAYLLQVLLRLTRQDLDSQDGRTAISSVEEAEPLTLHL